MVGSRWGEGLDVPPHPHIGLATVTYLFEGEIVHRDSLGSQQPIRPGDINWMTAGRGIAHSERTPADQRTQGSRLHGLQMWVALLCPTKKLNPRSIIIRVRACPSAIKKVYASGFSRARRSA
jgi:redox-sensitive bicupin YhaK (pirin superfamily)